jgi:hypothetical protein
MGASILEEDIAATVFTVQEMYRQLDSDSINKRQ